MTDRPESAASRLNRLRAGVLGANDGIVSTAALIIGVGAAEPSRVAIITAGLAALVAGAVSMAQGEFGSISAQRDSEREFIKTGELAATELVNPWQAAMSSAISFTAGALVPLLAVLVSPQPVRLPATFAAALVALIFTGLGSSRLGGMKPLRPTIRIVIGGVLAMGVTFAVGRLAGVAGL